MRAVGRPEVFAAHHPTPARPEGVVGLVLLLAATGSALAVFAGAPDPDRLPALPSWGALVILARSPNPPLDGLLTLVVLVAWAVWAWAVASLCVEFALALPVLLLLVGGLLDLGRVSYYGITIEDAARNAVRTLVSNDAGSGPGQAAGCADLKLLRNTEPILSNMKSQTFDGYVAVHARAWHLNGGGTMTNASLRPVVSARNDAS